MVKKIAIEEHCLFPGLQDYWGPTVTDLPASKRQAFLGRLTDFGEMRLEAMDKAGIERCMRELKFCGAMINGHTHGKYLDDRAFDPFWERAQALDALIYLHPADPVTPAPVLDGHKGLRRATWEWTFETGSHALRIVF